MTKKDPANSLQTEKKVTLQIIAGVVLYIICQLALAITAGAVYSSLNPSKDGVTVGEALASPGPAGPIAFGVSALVAIGGFFLIKRLIAKKRADEFEKSYALKEFGLGALVGAGIVALSVGIMALLGVYTPTGIELSLSILAGIMIGVGPAVVEEIFFRGILLRTLAAKFGPWSGLIVVSILFALVHGASSPAGPVASVFVFFTASLLLNMSYLLTKRLWLPIGLHLAFNATQSAIFGLSVTGTAAHGSLVQSTLQGPEILTGGVLGGEGSIILVIISFAVGVYMLRLGLRRGVFNRN